MAKGTAAPTRLRAAAVAYAEYVLTLDEWGRPPGARRSGRWTPRVIALAVVVYAVLIAYVIWRGDLDLLVFQLGFQVVITVGGSVTVQRGVRRRRELARAAVEANRPPTAH